MTTFSNDPDSWLSRGMDDLAESISRTLDIGAGLRDALLPYCYTELAEDIRGTLDISAGLAAILSTSGPGLLRPPPPSSGAGDGKEYSPSTSATAAYLRTLPPTTRLSLRGHPAVISLVLVFRLDIAINLGRELALHPARKTALTLGQILGLARDLTPVLGLCLGRDLSITLEESRMRALTLARDLAFSPGSGSSPDSHLATDLLSDLVNFRARTLSRCLDETSNYNHRIVEHFISDLSRERDLDHARDRARALLRARHIDFDDTLAESMIRDISRARNEFVNVDLSEAKLTGVPLLGIRWSHMTHWPPSWKDMIERYSEEIEPGIFEICDGMAYIDLDMVLAGF
ncbi:conserved hypothetical protein [Frankia sp. AiPs1]|uniref:hypothetical protein n=1 Tax=Frankia sp. AiPa1 TaxID=573492 RepID=UPI00202B82E1|nr:hypothetical protein [Frankia sp. AiPa1]MCL9760894.1 hypothetical protein [Frankia sp. AiPa1]